MEWGRLICIYHSVSPSTFNGGGERVSFAFTTVCLTLPLMEVGKGLICIYHSVSPSTLNGGGEGLICIYHSVSPSTLNGGVGGVSFAFTTVCLPLP